MAILQLISNFDLSARTLLVCMLLPFVYFGYQLQRRYRHKGKNHVEIFFSAIVSVLTLAVLIKLRLVAGDNGARDLAFLHLLALATSLAIFFAHHALTSDAGPARVKGVMGYQPTPLNKDVERVSWNELIVDAALKHELSSIIRLLKDPSMAKKYGIDVPKGILLNGPPGTGKTTVAKVIATEAGLSFFALKADEILSKWVGDSEKNLSALFQAAKRHAPAVLFIDEIDALGKQRSGAGGQEHREAFLNHLLQLLDGILSSRGIYIIAATNRADLVDAALKRPGRLSKVVDIPLPDLAARRALFELYLARIDLAEEVDVDILARMTDARSPAVIKEICNQAGLNAFKRESSGVKRRFTVTRDDLELALAEFL